MTYACLLFVQPDRLWGLRGADADVDVAGCQRRFLRFYFILCSPLSPPPPITVQVILCTVTFFFTFSFASVFFAAVFVVVP